MGCADEVVLVDHHCHAVLGGPLDRAAFEPVLTEADEVAPLGTSPFDSLVGLALRRRCPPLLDLPPHAAADQYLARRAELGAAEVNRRMLRSTGIGAFLLDTGLSGPELTTVDEFAGLAGTRAHEVLRLEALAEEVAARGAGAGEFAERVREELHAARPRVVGAKSVAAYRVGLALSGRRPADSEVTSAAGRFLASGGRLADEVLHRFLVREAVDAGLPVQFHVGYGDNDLTMHRADPSLLTDLLRATARDGVPITLLHNYPHHRTAAYLAQVFPHVFCDVGLATHNTGARAREVVAELLELAPFGKVLFSTDAFGLAELYHLGAALFRDAVGHFFDRGIADGEWTAADAERAARLIGRENALRAYGLPA